MLDDFWKSRTSTLTYFSIPDHLNTKELSKNETQTIKRELIKSKTEIRRLSTQLTHADTKLREYNKQDIRTTRAQSDSRTRPSLPGNSFDKPQTTKSLPAASSRESLVSRQSSRLSSGRPSLGGQSLSSLHESCTDSDTDSVFKVTITFFITIAFF